jgi:CPA2 family monovalent cation:H+ antiporter-2
MTESALILTLAGSLAAALVFGYLTQRLGLSPIVGYLIAGVAIGPSTPGFIADAHIAEQFAEIGVILLMFGVGLQFRVEELMTVRRIAIPGALAQSAVATLLGALAAHAFGWTWLSAIVFGMALSITSTVVLIRVLSDCRRLHTEAGHIAVGWLVVQDVIAVLVLVLLPALKSGSTPGSLAMSMAVALLKVGGLVAIVAFVGQRIIPAILDRIAKTQSRELFTLTVLAIAIGLAVGSAVVFGVSMALGAFLAGMVVGSSDYSLRAATDALPMRDAFAVLFFVSVGMLLRPASVLAHPTFMIAAIAIVMIANPLTAGAVGWLMGYSFRTVATVAIALGQIGEFSFILVTLERDLMMVPAEAVDIVVGAAIVSIMLNPLVLMAVDPLDRWFGQRATRDSNAMEIGASSSLDPVGRAIVVGYGPTGRTVTRLLKENGIYPTVVDLNIDTVRALRDEGVSAVYGDARYHNTLVSAGLPHAGTLIVSGADTGLPEIIKGARAINAGVSAASVCRGSDRLAQANCAEPR